MRPRLAPVILFVLAVPALLTAVPPDAPKPAAPEPDLPDGTEKALQHMAGFRLPKGLKVELFAAEPKLASPVAIGLDEKGRVFVAEEYRFSRGTEENRTRPFFLEDDLQIRTLDDRLKMYRKWAGKFEGGMDWFSKHADQVRLLEDTDGDGRADKSTVFAGGFNHPLDGLAAGVLARDGDVYLTCIPNLWRLRDTKGKGVADAREPLLTGFGVNCAFLGHDLHGLIFGPDGKLYFSVGDRGFNVTSKEGATLSGPRTGAVFRCDPDGSNLEVVMRGLRNPQELAFDQYGNLFADDNNCDKGDHARLVYVVEDGDCGWNMAYQTIPAPYTAGPWFAEKMWHLPHPGQPAWIVPPVGKIGTGPSGFLFTSGTTLPDRYKNSFIMCNYAGGRGLEAFRVTLKGAGFEVADYHDFMVPIMATDAEFGPDGKLYVSDFVNLDWSGRSLGGRIYTVSDPEKVKDPAVLAVKKLFAEGFNHRPVKDLADLLGHPDQKVRLRAQWAIASHAAGGKQADVVAALATVLADTTRQLPRLHAVWCLGQIARIHPLPPGAISSVLADRDPEVRAQAAKVAGDIGRAEEVGTLTSLLADPEPRVRFFAAQALGKLKSKPAIPGLFKVLAENKDADPFLRHACVAALARIGDADAAHARATDPSASVRLAVVLVQRRLRDKRVAQFLTDPDSLVRAEAARAVHDLPMEDLYPALAQLLPKLTASSDDDATARRCIDAAFRLGGAGEAKTVLAAAANPNLSPAVRVEAVAALRHWADPPQRDRVTGFWRPLGKRDTELIRGVVGPAFEKLLGSTSGALLTDVVGLIRPLELDVGEGTLGEWVADTKKEVPVRVAALRVLADRKAKTLPASVSVAIGDTAPLLRAEARDVLAATDPVKGTDLLAAALADETAPVVERQRAVAALARVKAPAAGRQLDAWADKLAAGAVPEELRLDVLDALTVAPAPRRDKVRAAFEAAQPGGPHAKFSVSLKGGDADRGREVFFGHAAAQCVRCHVVNGAGGNAGPDLSKVATRYPDRTREFFLESLLTPSAKIAPGFGTVTLALADGRTVSGVLAAEDKTAVTLQAPDGKKEVIPVADIERRSAATSPMPAVDRTLTPREVRDLVEYLTTLR
ncbi:MAG: repeat protein [Gemmataceae bacterium]|nr:repeat protein [Gemmataceae bacterium]